MSQTAQHYIDQLQDAISGAKREYASDDVDGALMLTIIEEDETSVQFIDHVFFWSTEASEKLQEELDFGFIPVGIYVRVFKYNELGRPITICMQGVLNEWKGRAWAPLCR